MTYIFLASGFEEVEALAPLDILRRAGVDVQLVSVTSDPMVVGAHGTFILCEQTLADINIGEANLLVLPGGLPGSTNLAESAELRQILQHHYDNGGKLAAICAAPLVFGRMGLLEGVRATCYPGFEGEMKGAQYTASLVEVDGQFITAKGPAAAMEFGYTLLEQLGYANEATQLREGMQYNFLMEARG